MEDENISRIVIKENEKAANMVAERHILPTKKPDYMKEPVNGIQTGK